MRGPEARLPLQGQTGIEGFTQERGQGVVVLFSNSNSFLVVANREKS